MFSRKLVAAFVGTAATLWAGAALAQNAAPPDHAKGEINRRIENQQDRIQGGVADDQLTNGEAARVERHDNEIHAQERQDRQQNGGNLTNTDKRQLNRELNRNSRQIHRERHNNRKPAA